MADEEDDEDEEEDFDDVEDEIYEDEVVEEDLSEEEQARKFGLFFKEPPQDWTPSKLMRYNKSFAAKLTQAGDQAKEWYVDLKNELLSYKRVHDRLSWKKESFRVGRMCVARLAMRGKTLCLYLALNPADYADTKYRVEDKSDMVSVADTPCLYRIKNSRRLKYAKQLIAVVMDGLTVRVERDAVDYYVPYKNTVDLLRRGLIKRVIRNDPAFDLESSQMEEKANAEQAVLEEVLEEAAATAAIDPEQIEIISADEKKNER